MKVVVQWLGADYSAYVGEVSGSNLMAHMGVVVMLLSSWVRILTGEEIFFGKGFTG